MDVARRYKAARTIFIMAISLLCALLAQISHEQPHKNMMILSCYSCNVLNRHVEFKFTRTLQDTILSMEAKCLRMGRFLYFKKKMGRFLNEKESLAFFRLTTGWLIPTTLRSNLCDYHDTKIAQPWGFF